MFFFNDFFCKMAFTGAFLEMKLCILLVGEVSRERNPGILVRTNRATDRFNLLVKTDPSLILRKNICTLYSTK